MTHWTCRGCGCDYNYMEPELVNGKTYCGMCSAGENKPDDKRASTNDWMTPIAMVLSFLFGMLFVLVLRRN